MAGGTRKTTAALVHPGLLLLGRQVLRSRCRGGRWQSVRWRCRPEDSAPGEGRPLEAVFALRTLARPSRKPAAGRDRGRTVRGLNGLGRGQGRHSPARLLRSRRLLLAAHLVFRECAAACRSPAWAYQACAEPGGCVVGGGARRLADTEA
eukprot:scaffold95326_cov46-Phaeocystis_antarctica.AAC.1